MSITTWDHSNTGGWRLSNANLTATSPDNNTMQSIFVGYGNKAIPDQAKTYFEYKVLGAAIQTAFTVGFGVHGFDPSNKNIAAEGKQLFRMRHSSASHTIRQSRTAVTSSMIRKAMRPEAPRKDRPPTSGPMAA